jgi:hypothetical protein
MVRDYFFALMLSIGTAIASDQSFGFSNDDNSTGTTPQPASESGASLLENAITGVQTVSAIAGELAGQTATTNQTEPANAAPYVWVRISRDRLANMLEKRVQRERQAKEVILGITFSGKSQTDGQTRLILHPSDTGVQAELVCEGEIEARMTGRQGPATLHYLSNSTFRARKPLLLDESGLKTLPAVADAPTRLTPVDISTDLPGLRGRLVERIAWRRAADKQAQADAIATEHRAQDVRERFDRRLDKKIASLQVQLQTELAELQKLGGHDAPFALKSSSTHEFVEIAIFPPATIAERCQMPQFEVADGSGVAVRVHRSVIASAMVNTALRDKLTSLAGVLQTRDTALPATAVSYRPPLNLVGDAEWLAFDIVEPAASEFANPLHRTLAADQILE